MRFGIAEISRNLGPPSTWIAEQAAPRAATASQVISSGTSWCRHRCVATVGVHELVCAVGNREPPGFREPTSRASCRCAVVHRDVDVRSSAICGTNRSARTPGGSGPRCAASPVGPTVTSTSTSRRETPAMTARSESTAPGATVPSVTYTSGSGRRRVTQPGSVASLSVCATDRCESQRRLGHRRITQRRGADVDVRIGHERVDERLDRHLPPHARATSRFTAARRKSRGCRPSAWATDGISATPRRERRPVRVPRRPRGPARCSRARP